VSDSRPDLTPLLPDEATLAARREALLEVVGGDRPAAHAGGPLGDQPPRRHRRALRLTLAGALVAAGVAVALVLSAGGGDTPKAFAVEPREGGGTTIEIYSLEDAAGLEAAFAEAGVKSEVTWLPTGQACREPYFQKSASTASNGEELTMKGGAGVPSSAGLMEISILTAARYQGLKRESEEGVPAAVEFFKAPPLILIDPSALRADQSIVISGFRGPLFGHPGGGYEYRMSVAEGPVGTCEPVAQPGGGVLGLMNRQAEAAGR
jgi:hypothetical protein